MLRAAVVIPTLNEEKAIVDVISELIDTGLPPCNVFVVDNGSTDRTVPLVKNTFHNKVQIISCKIKGKGFAVRLGFMAVNVAIQNGWVKPIEYVFTIDGDYTYPASAIRYAMETHVGEPALTMIRQPTDGSMPWINGVANKIINVWANMIYPPPKGQMAMRDICSGLWGFEWRNFWENVAPRLSGTGFTIEADYFCTLRRLGYEIKQYNGPYRPRLGGEKKTKPIDALRIINYIWKHSKRQEVETDILHHPVVKNVMETGLHMSRYLGGPATIGGLPPSKMYVATDLADPAIKGRTSGE